MMDATPTSSASSLALVLVGRVRSSLRSLDAAPRQGDEGAPDAWLDVDDRFAVALSGLSVGDVIIIVTWLDRARRDVLEVHPRDDASNPLTGIFATRSPHRPNPIGLHRVTIRAIEGAHLLVGPIEAVDGTPVVDLKIALDDRDR